jgi:hypothetical protein
MHVSWETARNLCNRRNSPHETKAAGLSKDMSQHMSQHMGRAAMYGHITKFREDIGVGVIASDNGRKYRFVKDALISGTKPLVGEEVDFLMIASRPSQIIMMSGSPWRAFGDICARAANDRE